MSRDEAERDVRRAWARARPPADIAKDLREMADSAERAGGRETASTLREAADALAANATLLDRLAAAEKALQRLANPEHAPATEEAALVQIEVQAIAREALRDREPGT